MIMNQLKYIYNLFILFKDSHSHPIYTCFPIIANNDYSIHADKDNTDLQTWKLDRNHESSSDAGYYD